MDNLSVCYSIYQDTNIVWWLDSWEQKNSLVLNLQAFLHRKADKVKYPQTPCLTLPWIQKPNTSIPVNHCHLEYPHQLTKHGAIGCQPWLTGSPTNLILWNDDPCQCTHTCKPPEILWVLCNPSLNYSISVRMHSNPHRYQKTCPTPAIIFCKLISSMLISLKNSLF